MNKKIYVVIVTYNGEKDIVSCLNSLKQSEYPLQILIIDNNSVDKTCSIIANQYPEVRLIKNKENVGFGAANNQGMKIAMDNGFDYVFLLNQDASIQPNTIGELVEVHKKNPNFGILSPIHLNGTGSLLDENFTYHVDYSRNKEFISDYVLSNNQVKEFYQVPFVNAAAWLVSVTLIQNVGGFADIFFYRGEDDNYCNRVLFHQYKIGIVTTSFIFHNRDCAVKNSSSSGNLLQMIEWSKPGEISTSTLEYEHKIKNLKRLVFSQKMKLKFKESNLYKKELLNLMDIYKKANQCALKTKQKGAHYL